MDRERSDLSCQGCLSRQPCGYQHESSSHCHLPEPRSSHYEHCLVISDFAFRLSLFQTLPLPDILCSRLSHFQTLFVPRLSYLQTLFAYRLSVSPLKHVPLRGCDGISPLPCMTGVISVQTIQLDMLFNPLSPDSSVQFLLILPILPMIQISSTVLCSSLLPCRTSRSPGTFLLPIFWNFSQLFTSLPFLSGSKLTIS
jgi:hypothetical protein